MNVTLKPFTVPNFVIAERPPVRREDGFREAPSYPLSEVDAEELSAMCDAFRAGVFQKAGKMDPRRKGGD